MRAGGCFNTYQIPRNLNHHVCEHECFPGVRFRWSLPNFVQRPGDDEKWYRLLYKGHEGCKERKDSEELTSQSLLSSARLEKSEANEDHLH